MSNIQVTPFSKIYDSFLSKITDDMYMELTELDTFHLLEELLISAIPKFEFPRVDINDYETTFIEDEDTYNGVESDNVEVRAIIYSSGYFVNKLSQEEINVLSTYMIVEWLGQQLASVENTRMKYSGSDFRFTSQANHMQKLLALKKDYEREGFHLQRLYKRRKADKSGIMRSTMGTIMEPIGYSFNAETSLKTPTELLEDVIEQVDQIEEDTEELQDYVETALSWGEFSSSRRGGL